MAETATEGRYDVEEFTHWLGHHPQQLEGMHNPADLAAMLGRVIYKTSQYGYGEGQYHEISRHSELETPDLRRFVEQNPGKYAVIAPGEVTVKGATIAHGEILICHDNFDQALYSQATIRGSNGVTIELRPNPYNMALCEMNVDGENANNDEGVEVVMPQLCALTLGAAEEGFLKLKRVKGAGEARREGAIQKRRDEFGTKMKGFLTG